MGMRVLFYLDNQLWLARSREGGSGLQTIQLVSHLSNLGFIINWKKSCPRPSQVIFLTGSGIELRPHESATLTAERGESDSSPPAHHTPRGGDSPLRDAAVRHDISWSRGDPPGSPS